MPIQQPNQTIQEIGIVKSVRGFLVFIEGLPTIKVNDLVESNGAFGVVTALLDNLVSVFMLQEISVKPGQVFKRANQTLTIQVGDFLLGRTIDPLGASIDGKKILTQKGTASTLEKPAPPISSRQFI